MTDGPSSPSARSGPLAWLARLRPLGTFLLYLLMLVAILALWNDDAPQFIYVAF